MTEAVLFVGNGINQASSKRISWGALLDKLYGDAVTPHESKVRRKKPFTLQYEEIAAIRESADSLRETLIEGFEEFQSTALHSAAMALGIKNILTTNYDYLLESAAQKLTGIPPISNNTAQESLYSLFRRRSCGELNIWHIHGELSNANSIMLGHSHYAGYLRKIRNFLAGEVSTDSSSRQKKPYFSRFSKKHLEAHELYVESWVDLFLDSEIHMIGFGMDYTENHIWNLLIKKQEIRKKKEARVGKVYFHCRQFKKLNLEDEARRSLLKSFGVQIVPHAGKDYAKSYHCCLQWIERHISATQQSHFPQV